MSRLLSLCIPTYNRARFLEISLKAILESINPIHAKDIQIVISNNLSEDDTTAVIESFQAQNFDIDWVVIQQKINIGPSNVTVVTQYATGDYLWILSDDDIVMPEAINNIFPILKENLFNGIIINYAPFKENIKYIKNPVLPNIKISEQPDDILGFLSSQLTFLSILIFRRELTQLPDNDRRRSSLCQCYMFLDIISKGKIYYLPAVSLAVRGNNSGGYDFFKVFIEEFESVLFYAGLLNFSNKAINTTRIRHFPFLLYFSISLRLQKKESLRNLKAIQIIWHHYPLKFIPMVTISILILPNFFFNIFTRLRNALRLS